MLGRTGARKLDHSLRFSAVALGLDPRAHGTRGTELGQHRLETGTRMDARVKPEHDDLGG